jgi:hypothetical protein
MTRASALDQARASIMRSKPMNSLFLRAAAQVLLCSCVVPLPYQEEEMTTDNYPPVIRSANPSMGYTGTTLQIFSDNPRAWFITVEDRNVEDVLHVRVLKDYQPEEPFGSLVFDEEYASTDATLRTLELHTRAWCPMDVIESFMFEVIVADGPFDAARPYHNLVSGDSTTRAWRAECTPENP